MQEYSVLQILSFLNIYGGNQYKKIEKCKDDSERLYMENGREAGKTARSSFAEIVQRLEIELGFKSGKITQWQNSGTFVSYFWCQLKKEEYFDNNISISLFAEKCDNVPRFRLSIELAVERATEEEKAAYRKILDLPLKEDLVYISGGNNEPEFRILEETDNKIVKDMGLNRVQVSFIPKDSLRSNNEIIGALLDAAKVLILYYDHVFEHEDEGGNITAWWPSLSQYDPGISREKWLQLLNDGSTFTSDAYIAVAALYDYGGTASCKQLELQYGRTSNFYNVALSIQLASRVRQKLDLPYCIKDSGEKKVWPILFQGRDATAEEAGTYVWRIRPELYDALTEFQIQKYLVPSGGEEAMSISNLMQKIKAYIASKGFSYEPGLIENFYLCLKSKPFVILAGTSGTGKTRLVRLFAEAIGATSANGRYQMVSVRPDWSDSTDLFGHVDLNSRFIPGAIIDFIRRAGQDTPHPYILCLDEMNLARVEYYLSDFLSVMETRDFDGAGMIVTDPLVPESYYGSDRAAREKYGTMMIPENLYIVGTVNMDETTFPFSRKVLDRANTIEFSYVDLMPGEPVAGPVSPMDLPNSFLKTEYLLLQQCRGQDDFVQRVCGELQKINEILQTANAHVGYRVRDEIVFYLLNNYRNGLLSEDAAFDNAIMQKILPRIQGSSGSVKRMLCDLFKVCAGDYEGVQTETDDVSSRMLKAARSPDCKNPNSANKIAFMVRRYEEDGFTSYWL